jgi:hypothetical protein
MSVSLTQISSSSSSLSEDERVVRKHINSSVRFLGEGRLYGLMNMRGLHGVGGMTGGDFDLGGVFGGEAD